MYRGKVLLAISGGVDSTAAAVLLMQSGYYVEGATMRLWSDDIYSAEKCVEDSADVCAALGIKHRVLNYKNDFKDEIVSYFLREYQNGRTPNPCVLCNRRFKFGRFYRDALEDGFDFIATGHYARICESNGKKAVLRAAYQPKDQSYVLYNLKEEMLRHILFPLGDISKAEARAIAARHKLPSAESRESQEICFIKSDDYIDFLSRFGPPSPRGNFVDMSGNVLGEHRGITSYTVGQRKGLGITFGEPKYVVSINADDNTVTLGGNEDTYSSAVECRDFSFISDEYLKQFMKNNYSHAAYGGKIQAKIRYKGPLADADAVISDGVLRISFKAPQRAATPGQSAVLYSGDMLLGGGVIDHVIK